MLFTVTDVQEHRLMAESGKLRMTIEGGSLGYAAGDRFYVARPAEGVLAVTDAVPAADEVEVDAPVAKRGRAK